MVLPPKIRSCILLRLQLQTTGSIIQTFGAKIWICIFVLFLGLSKWRQWWRHHLWLLKKNRSKTRTPRRWGRWWKFSTKNWRSGGWSCWIGTPKTPRYPEGWGPPFSNGREPLARPGPVAFSRMFWRILVVWSQSKNWSSCKMFHRNPHLKLTEHLDFGAFQSCLIPKQFGFQIVYEIRTILFRFQTFSWSTWTTERPDFECL